MTLIVEICILFELRVARKTLCRKGGKTLVSPVRGRFARNTTALAYPDRGSPLPPKKSHAKFAKFAKLSIGERLRRKPPKIMRTWKARLFRWFAGVFARHRQQVPLKKKRRSRKRFRVADEVRFFRRKK